MRHLKLGLFAALVLSVTVAATASAEHFTSEVAHTTLQGSESARTHFTTGSGTIECTEVSYSGTTSAATVTSVTITPSYPKCWHNEPAHTAAPNATVNMNGCTYTFTIENTLEHNQVHVVCPVGKKIEISVPGCQLTVGPQTVGEDPNAGTTDNGVKYTTGGIGSTHDLTVDITLKEIAYEKHGLCVFVAPTGTGPHSDGVLTGQATLKGLNTAGQQVGITAT